jgi:hypothetical protein
LRKAEKKHKEFLAAYREHQKAYTEFVKYSNELWPDEMKNGQTIIKQQAEPREA